MFLPFDAVHFFNFGQSQTELSSMRRFGSWLFADAMVALFEVSGLVIEPVVKQQANLCFVQKSETNKGLVPRGND